METSVKNIVLVTGGSGFMGQHIIRELQTKENSVDEIRVLDLKPYHNFMSKLLKYDKLSYTGLDIYYVHMRAAACQTAAGILKLSHKSLLQLKVKYYGKLSVLADQKRSISVSAISVTGVPVDHPEPKPLLSIIGDVGDKASIQNAFAGVRCVFHCAAYVSYEYPPNHDELDKTNIQGTKNVIDLCKENDVEKLIFTSTSEVSLVPFMVRPSITVIVNQTEKKAAPPSKSARFIIPGYAESKLNAENLVLEVNGSKTEGGKILKTVALRPAITYGEEDPSFITSMISVAHKAGGQIPRISGAGGKQQVAYAGNIAWGHICAMNALSSESEEISGLPVFLTDDTTVMDTTRLCQRLTKTADGTSLCQPSWWFVPLVVSMFLAIVLQTFSSITSIRIPASPVALVSYLGSFIYFSRVRASIHMQYSPVYNEEESTKLASRFYTKFYKALDEGDLKKIHK